MSELTNLARPEESVPFALAQPAQKGRPQSKSGNPRILQPATVAAFKVWGGLTCHQLMTLVSSGIRCGDHRFLSLPTGIWKARMTAVKAAKLMKMTTPEFID